MLSDKEAQDVFYNERCNISTDLAGMIARSIIAAYQAKLLADVEMPEPTQYVNHEHYDYYTADQLQQYAAAAAAQERKRIEVAAMEWVASGGSTNLLSAIRGETK